MWTGDAGELASQPGSGAEQSSKGEESEEEGSEEEDDGAEQQPWRPRIRAADAMEDPRWRLEIGIFSSEREGQEVLEVG